VFTVDFDLSDIRDALRLAEREINHGAENAVRLAASEGLAYSRARRRYKDRTGQLSDFAYSTIVSRSVGKPEAEIVWPVAYASFVEEGTKPHPIEARRAPNLVFYWPKIGGVFVGKRVNHPGTKAYGFAGDAYRKAEDVLIREAELGVEAAQRILSR